MKKKLFFGTVASLLIMFSILSVNVSQSRSGDSSLKNLKIMSQAMATTTVNPDCPNGCLDNGAGCRCNGYHPHYLEYGSLNHLSD